jgi:hypothetical protein
VRANYCENNCLLGEIHFITDERVHQNDVFQIKSVFLIFDSFRKIQTNAFTRWLLGKLKVNLAEAHLAPVK